jgi:hypothetical protein
MGKIGSDKNTPESIKINNGIYTPCINERQK